MQQVSTGVADCDEAGLSLDVRKRRADGFEITVKFAVAPGFTILFGASGAGKTTLLDCIAGLLQPDEGYITIAQREVFAAGQGIDVAARRRRVGYVFQDLALFPHLSVEKNVQYGISATESREQKQRSDQILQLFRIHGLRNRRPGQISGGERQRVALARALVTDPSALLLDEPLSGLDLPTKSAIIEDLRAWNEGHRIPILYVTHNREEVFALGERVLVLDRGKLIAEGTPHQVFSAPRQETVAQLAGFENIFDAVVLAINEQRGTMTCRVADSIALETPLVSASVGTNLRVGIHAGDILLATVRPQGLSAQNIIPGKLVSLAQRDVLVVASVDCGVEFAAHLTLAARDSLQLQIGRDVWLIVKTHSCHLLAT